jgi:NAD(P)-dependent dehydrogenase (short-subunit alcohol dehydrogenase family)
LISRRHECLRLYFYLIIQWQHRRIRNVTGGSRGIGFAIAYQLGLDGYNVVIMATSAEDKNQENMNMLKAAGIEYTYVQGNIGDSKDRENLVRKTAERYGAIHVLINNAVVAPNVRADLLEMSEEVSFLQMKMEMMSVSFSGLL